MAADKLVNRNIIKKCLFDSDKWLDTVIHNGLLPIFVGNDLQRLSDHLSGPSGAEESAVGQRTPFYITLCFFMEDNIFPVSVHTTGFPHQELFEQCLRAWEPQDTHHLRLKGVDIVLNISEYRTFLEPSIDISMFADISILKSRHKPKSSDGKSKGECLQGQVCSTFLHTDWPIDMKEIIVPGIDGMYWLLLEGLDGKESPEGEIRSWQFFDLSSLKKKRQESFEPTGP